MAILNAEKVKKYRERKKAENETLKAEIIKLKTDLQKTRKKYRELEVEKEKISLDRKSLYKECGYFIIKQLEKGFLFEQPKNIADADIAYLRRQFLLSAVTYSGIKYGDFIEIDALYFDNQGNLLTK